MHVTWQTIVDANPSKFEKNKNVHIIVGLNVKESTQHILLTMLRKLLQIFGEKCTTTNVLLIGFF